MPGRLPAPRRALRPAHRPPADAAGLPARRDLPGRGRGRHRHASTAVRPERAAAGRRATRSTSPTTTRSGAGPVRDERGLYERLCLEGFQSGLSWLTILRKREAFRPRSPASTPSVVARFGGARRRAAARRRGHRPPPRQDRGDDRERARDAGAARGGAAAARAALVVRARRAPAPRAGPTGSRRRRVGGALEAASKRHGFRFVGPTTVLRRDAGVRGRRTTTSAELLVREPTSRRKESRFADLSVRRR